MTAMLDPAKQRKQNGVHYTPEALAGFVAARVLDACPKRQLSVLDPACGDGVLLAAIAQAAETLGLPAPSLTGSDLDPAAVEAAQDRLQDVYSSGLELAPRNYLTDITTGDQLSLDNPPGTEYDVVISNPPYVRTQVLGQARARELGRMFGLRGRVDLYQAFVCAMTFAVKPGGVLGLICSNRFLSTQAGSSLREFLLKEYGLRSIWDLGDTKLFDAAVLPAVVVGQRHGEVNCEFIQIYEDRESSEKPTRTDSVLGALDEHEGLIETHNGTRFQIERGTLDVRSHGWTLTSPRRASWLETVAAHAKGTIGDLGAIRVGIKTTADKVFIRDDWESLPTEETPERELLYDLITHHVAARWHVQQDERPCRRVLYPHQVVSGTRRPVELAQFPRAHAYLKGHQERLAARKYLQEAGRRWYEIWVPQDPRAWSAPKVVWPDIAERPRFSLDTSGAIVNGDCYWLSAKALSEQEVATVLAVANSSFATRYYDIAFGNKLYAGRRRFITQYVEKLPLPRLDHRQLHDISEMVNALRVGGQNSEAIEAQLDEAIWEAFGLSQRSQQAEALAA